MNWIQQQFDSQHFANEYQLVNGVAIHTENPNNFHIPPDVIKRHVKPGQFVELRIDSPRFSVHENAAEKCSCPSCNGELSTPILKHDHGWPVVEFRVKKFNRRLVAPPVKIMNVFPLVGLSLVVVLAIAPSLTVQNLGSPSQPLRVLPSKSEVHSCSSENVSLIGEIRTTAVRKRKHFIVKCLPVERLNRKKQSCRLGLQVTYRSVL